MITNFQTSLKPAAEMTQHHKRRHASRKFSLRGLVINSLLLSIVVGCSQPGPELAPVTGKVLLNGQPLPGMIVEFQPVGKSPSIGVTDHDGRFKLRFTRDRWGALIGEHLVKIDHDIDGRKSKTLVRIPPRYNTKSELKREVVKGSNSFDFELQADARTASYRK